MNKSKEQKVSPSLLIKIKLFGILQLAPIINY